MRKINRIMMVTVSILLSLALATTCFLSGIFAKYITAEDIYAQTTLKAFGVTVTASVGDSVKAVVEPDPDESAVTVTVNNLKIKPGDDFSDAIRFTITGTAEVKLQVRLISQITYNGESYNNFKIPEGIGDVANNTYCMPVGFTFGALNSSGEYVVSKDFVANPWRSYTGTSPESTSNSEIGMDSTERIISQGIRDKIDASYKATGNSYVYKNFNTPKQNIVFYSDSDTSKSNPINTFEVGFAWPIEADIPSGFTRENMDEIETWLGNKLDDNGATITITYTLQIVQNQP